MCFDMFYMSTKSVIIICNNVLWTCVCAYLILLELCAAPLFFTINEVNIELQYC